MSQWHVELNCKRPKLLAYLTTTLQEPLCTVIAGSTDCYFINPGSHAALSPRKTSGYFLLSSEFDSLTDAGEVHSRAKTMLPFLNALVKLTIGEYTTPIDIDDVFRPDTQGRMIREIMTATWTVNTLESKLQNAPGQPLNFTEIWHLMQKHPEVDEVINYLANETNWFNLYKAYEIIKKETHRLESSRTIRGSTFNGWTSGRKLDFEESANKERHSSFGYHPKPGVTIVYMSLDEAAEFVTKLFFQWSQTK
jgi:hypothetical protein